MLRNYHYFLSIVSQVPFQYDICTLSGLFFYRVIKRYYKKITFISNKMLKPAQLLTYPHLFGMMFGLP